MGKCGATGLEGHKAAVPGKGDDRREALGQAVIVDQVHEALIIVGRLYRAHERAIELKDGKATQSDTKEEE